jgi:Pyridoxamine 5'-phosphate oxidase
LILSALIESKRILKEETRSFDRTSNKIDRMGQRFDEITPELQRFIEVQSIFFVATAALSSDGHVNLSPKGLDSLRVFGPRQVAYLDLTGSGNETSAHITQNGRLTIMLCAFTGKPRILRLYCRSRVVTRSSGEWALFST